MVQTLVPRRMRTVMEKLHLFQEKDEFSVATPNLFGTRNLFHGRQFFHGPGVCVLGDGVEGEVGRGWFECITFILHFISIIITSALPQVIRLEIPKVGDPWFSDRHEFE